MAQLRQPCSYPPAQDYVRLTPIHCEIHSLDNPPPQQTEFTWLCTLNTSFCPIACLRIKTLEFCIKEHIKLLNIHRHY